MTYPPHDEYVFCPEVRLLVVSSKIYATVIRQPFVRSAVRTLEHVWVRKEGQSRQVVSLLGHLSHRQWCRDLPTLLWSFSDMKGWWGLSNKRQGQTWGGKSEAMIIAVGDPGQCHRHLLQALVRASCPRPRVRPPPP